MPRQKKIKKYVLNTVLPTKARDGADILWENRSNYTLEKLFTSYDEIRKGAVDPGGWMVDDFKQRLSAYAVDENTWRDLKDDSNARYVINRMLRRLWPHSQEFDKLNAEFLAEYNSREDLQEVYREFSPNCSWINDRYGKTHARGRYYENQEKESQGFWDDFNKGPVDFTIFQQVYETNAAKAFVEKHRETPFQPGDLVKLRPTFVDHPDHDPMWVSRYNSYRTGQSTPDRSVDRIGMVMKVTDHVSWRGTKGSKEIEVLWQGKTETNRVPEKVLKWEERPTLKNGLKKREE